MIFFFNTNISSLVYIILVMEYYVKHLKYYLVFPNSKNIYLSLYSKAQNVNDFCTTKLISKIVFIKLAYSDFLEKNYASQVD